MNAICLPARAISCDCERKRVGWGWGKGGRTDGGGNGKVRKVMIRTKGSKIPKIRPKKVWGQFGNI